MNVLEGIHKDFTFWIDQMRFEVEEHFRNYIHRLRALVSQVVDIYYSSICVWCVYFEEIYGNLCRPMFILGNLCVLCIFDFGNN